MEIDKIKSLIKEHSTKPISEQFYNFADILKNIDTNERKLKFTELLDITINLLEQYKIYYSTPLWNYIKEDIKLKKSQSVIIHNAELFIKFIKFPEDLPCNKIELVTAERFFYEVFDYLYSHESKITITHSDLYSSGELTGSTDYIISSLYFDNKKRFDIFKLLNKLNPNGNLKIIVSPRVMQETAFGNSRKVIIESQTLETITLLPMETFDEITRNKIHLLTLSKGKNDEISVKTLKYDDIILIKNKTTTISYKELSCFPFWSIEPFIMDDYSIVREYLNSSQKKIALGDVFNIRLGKAIYHRELDNLTNNQSPNSKWLQLVGMTNITNHFNFIINTDDKNFSDDINNGWERYILEAGDIIVSNKGREVKLCTVSIPVKFDKTLIAGTGIITLRIKEITKYHPDYIVFFFQTELGKKYLQLIQRGSEIFINLNSNDLQYVEIPDLSFNEQMKIVDRLRDFEEFKKDIVRDWIN